MGHSAQPRKLEDAQECSAQMSSHWKDLSLRFRSGLCLLRHFQCRQAKIHTHTQSARQRTLSKRSPQVAPCNRSILALLCSPLTCRRLGLGLEFTICLLRPSMWPLLHSENTFVRTELSVVWVKPSGQTLLPFYLLSSLLLTSTQVVQFQLYELHLYSSSCLR